jgi:hypothetical protein
MHQGVARISRRALPRHLRFLHQIRRLVGVSRAGVHERLPTIQFRYDLWYVDGGLYNIASACAA